MVQLILDNCDKMARAAFFIFLLGLCQAQVNDADEDLAKLLEQIFGKAPTTNVSGLPTNIPAPIPSLKEKDEVPMVESNTQCMTADGREGSCTVPSGCTKILSPLRKSDKGICIGADEICCGFEDISLSGVETVPKSGCGWRNGDNTEILSDNTEFAEFPWIVAVLKVVPANPEKPEGSKLYLYTCGGSVIHPRVVLTTAHNVYEKNLNLRARAGEWNTTSEDEVLPYQDRNVERIIIHELFNTKRTNLFNDVALLVLDKPLDFVSNVNSICLPPAGERAVDGTRCFSAGWGKKKFGKAGAYQTVLKKVQIPVIDRSKCQRELRKTRLGPVFNLHNTFMCAGGEPNKDTCTGDGGSPLMCPINGQVGRYTASGMVAWGLGCGDALPAVYADVGALRPWIDAKMAELGFGQDSYTY
ncbi:phenoloxidase-activating factor 2 [Papilio machaon]|uniref:phenoloxidase-activating factor 2 n=1 Tax=Papilio machaon TaxID=76193 RepID=UPI001E6629FA|nr:phenoloxidase-activating factor 2 [Papilio machaon]